MELESYDLASRQRSKAVREARLDNRPNSGFRKRRHSPEDATTGVLEKLQQCMDTMERVAAKVAGASGQRAFPQGDHGRRELSQRRSKTVTCWSCGEQGHIRRECKKTVGKEVPTGAATAPGNGR